MEPGGDVVGAMKRTSLLGIVLCACTKTATAAPVDTPPEAPTPAAPAALPAHPGCMLVLDLETDELVELGDGNCDDTTNPASTFKVPHALFALQTGVVTDPDESVKWDGSDQYFDVWEQDHNLRTAIYHSVVWFFQGTARAIGEAKMTELLRAIDYGNADPSSAIDRFWLGGGSLLVTGHDQLAFMRRLVRDDLPIDAEHMALVRELMVRPPSSFKGRMLDGHAVPPTSDQLTFGAKTGTAMLGDGSVTWLIGYGRCAGDDPGYVFVSRVRSDEPVSSNSPAATHGLQALHALGRLDC